MSRLELGDVDLLGRTLQVQGKFGHWRPLPITDEAAVGIDAYLSEHPATGGPLIRAYVGGLGRRVTAEPPRPVQPSQISRIVARACRDAGVHRHAWDGVTAHALRHTMARDMVDRGADLRDVQTALGHASIATTGRYMGLTRLADLRRAMEGRSYFSA